MAKEYIVFIILFSIAITAHGDLIGDENWLLPLALAKQKVTQLQLYVEDILSGPVPTNIVVAAANSTLTSPTFFGLVAVLDNPVRIEASPAAKIVGRAQGIIAFDSLQEASIHMTFDLVFSSGKYNGSCLNVVGQNPYLRPQRDLSIVGGSGKFRLARGFIGVRTVFMNATTGDAFFQYNITVLHY